MTILLKITLLFVICIFPQQSWAVLPTNLSQYFIATSNKIPTFPWIPPKSQLENTNQKNILSVGWSDKLGENRLIFTQSQKPHHLTAERAQLSSNCYNSKIYAYHYIEDGSHLRLIRKVYDFIKHCPDTQGIDFLDNSLTITDLDSNGIAEITFLYKMYCDNSSPPCAMKLIMLENDKKYALRSNKNQKPSPNSFKIDKVYEHAPKTFLEFSLLQWQKYE